MVFQVNRECVKAFLEPKCLNPRKTMISSLIRPRYKLNKVLSDPYCMCVIALNEIMCKVGNANFSCFDLNTHNHNTCVLERNTILMRSEAWLIFFDVCHTC